MSASSSPISYRSVTQPQKLTNFLSRPSLLSPLPHSKNTTFFSMGKREDSCLQFSPSSWFQFWNRLLSGNPIESSHPNFARFPSEKKIEFQFVDFLFSTFLVCQFCRLSTWAGLLSFPFPPPPPPPPPPPQNGSRGVSKHFLFFRDGFELKPRYGGEERKEG